MRRQRTAERTRIKGASIFGRSLSLKSSSESNLVFASQGEVVHLLLPSDGHAATVVKSSPDFHRMPATSDQKSCLPPQDYNSISRVRLEGGMNPAYGAGFAQPFNRTYDASFRSFLTIRGVKQQKVAKAGACFHDSGRGRNNQRALKKLPSSSSRKAHVIRLLF